MLFDASEYIDPEAIARSLKEIRGYQMQPAQPMQQRQQPTMPTQSVVQAPQQQQGGDNGILGTILSIFM